MIESDELRGCLMLVLWFLLTVICLGTTWLLMVYG
jgi:hypothetical protein